VLLVSGDAFVMTAVLTYVRLMHGVFSMRYPWARCIIHRMCLPKRKWYLKLQFNIR